MEPVPNLITVIIDDEKVRSPKGIGRIRNRGVRLCLERLQKGNLVDAEYLRTLGGFRSVQTMISSIMIYSDQLDTLGVELAQQGIASGKGRLRLRPIKR